MCPSKGTSERRASLLGSSSSASATSAPSAGPAAESSGRRYSRSSGSELMASVFPEPNAALPPPAIVDTDNENASSSAGSRSSTSGGSSSKNKRRSRSPASVISVISDESNKRRRKARPMFTERTTPSTGSGSASTTSTRSDFPSPPLLPQGSQPVKMFPDLLAGPFALGSSFDRIEQAVADYADLSPEAGPSSSATAPTCEVCGKAKSPPAPGVGLSGPSQPSILQACECEDGATPPQQTDETTTAVATPSEFSHLSHGRSETLGPPTVNDDEEEEGGNVGDEEI